MEMHLFASVLDQFLYSTSSRDSAKTLPSVLNNFVTLVQTLWEAYLLATGAHSFFLIFFITAAFNTAAGGAAVTLNEICTQN